MKKNIVAGNWKMNKTPAEGRSFLTKIVNLLLDIKRTEVIFCPPFPGLFGLDKLLEGTGFSLGAQNCYWEKQGAFTGEVSPQMLKTCGVEYVIVGHSERRHRFGESDEWINLKIQAVLECGMKPIFCIGETSQERKKVETQSILVRQLTEGLSGIISLEKVILAYEPVWAIGTGENAFPEQVEEANQIIRSWIGNFYGVETGDKVPILYGGSVNPENTVELIQTGGIDGFLIGGASLHVESFCSIVQQVDKKY